MKLGAVRENLGQEERELPFWNSARRAPPEGSWQSRLKIGRARAAFVGMPLR